MEITAKVIARLDKRSGTSASGKPWVSQDYVVTYDYDSQYPHNMILNFFGEQRVTEAQQLLHKDTIATFSYDVDAKQSPKDPSRWFQSLGCFKVVVPQQTAPVTNGASVAPQPAPQPTPVSGSTSATPDPFLNEQPSDDLPF